MTRWAYVNGVRYDESEVDEYIDYDYDGAYFDDEEEVANTKYDIRRKERESEYDRSQDS